MPQVTAQAPTAQALQTTVTAIARENNYLFKKIQKKTTTP